ncbi:HYR domain-containing protein [Persicobacter diffluens]|uniref:HYR domain-containing protein n=1 Tax=Persicobacter diffluens TaxID=981 RepID=A0AAN4W163_9BACT|nr:hypothetical protein PEDI_37540 [Persicobacter diffluens]
MNRFLLLSRIFCAFFCIVIFLVLSKNVALAQESNVHYVPPFFYKLYKDGSNSGSTNNHDVNEHFAILSTNENVDVDVELKYYLNGSLNVLGTYTVSKSGPLRLKLADYKSGDDQVSDAELFGDNNAGEESNLHALSVTGPDGTVKSVDRRIKDFLLLTEMNLTGHVLPAGGLVFEAVNPEQKFFLNITHLADPQAGILTSKGEFAAGTKFFTGHMVSGGSNNSERRNHFVSFMALEDGTQVNIAAGNGFQFFNPSTGAYDLLDANYSRSVVLNKGESYIMGYHFKDNWHNDSSDKINDVNGTLLTTNGKKIIVNSGSWNAGGNSGYGHDIGIDQLVPVDYIGEEYIIARGPGEEKRSEIEQVIVVATENNSILEVNGVRYSWGGSEIKDAGEYWIVTNDQYKGTGNQAYMYLKTTQPSYVYQTVAGEREGSGQNTPGMFLVPRLNCNGARNVTVSFAKTLGAPQVRIIARTDHLKYKLDNGSELDLLGATHGVQISEASDWYLYTITDAHDLYEIWSADGVSPVNVALTIASGNIGAGGFYSGFGEVPIITMTPELEKRGLCAGDATLEVSGPQTGWIYNWYKDGVLIPEASGLDKTSYEVTEVGEYRVTAETGCGDVTYPSDPIEIFPCLEIDPMSMEVDEDAGVVSVLVKRLQSFADDVFFTSKVEDVSTNTMSEFQDYTVQTIASRIKASESQTAMTFQITDDHFDENDEIFKVIFSEPYNATFSADEIEVPITIKDNDPEPYIKVIPPNSSATEGTDNSLTFTIQMANGMNPFYGSGKLVSFDYQFSDVTATYGSDYTVAPVSGTVIFQPGETQKEIVVDIIDDPYNEDQETFELTLSNAVNAQGFEEAGIQSSITVSAKIDDNDPEPVVVITTTPATEGNPIVFTAELQNAGVAVKSGKEIQFSYRTQDVTAEDGLDYTGGNDIVVTIPKMTESKTFEVPTLTDAIAESAEYFDVYFYNHQNAKNSSNGSTNTLKAQINDSNASPELSLSSATTIEGGDLVFKLSTTIQASEDITLGYRTELFEAKSGMFDFIGNGSITIPAGDLETTITIATYDDDVVDGNRRMKLILKEATVSPSGITFFNSTAFGTILEDDETPVANDDLFTYQETDIGTTYSGDVSLNDTGKGMTPEFSLLSQDFTIAEGEFTFNTDGSFDFTPVADFYGTLTFTYELETKVGKASATATIEITNVNDVPTASNDSYTLDEGTTITKLFTVGGLGDGGIVYSIIAQPSKGTVAITNQVTGEFEYTSVSPDFGQDEFTFQVKDVDGEVASGVITLDINYVNYFAPVAVADEFTINDEGPADLDVLLNDTDQDGNALKIDKPAIFEIKSQPAQGNVVFDYDKNVVKFTPVAGGTGTFYFTYSFRDKPDGNNTTNTSNTVTVKVNVISNNQPPVANCVAGPVTVSLDASGNGTLNAVDLDNGSSDPDGDAITFALSQSNFSCSDIGNGTVDLIVTDAKGASSTCSVPIQVVDPIAPIARAYADIEIDLLPNQCSVTPNFAVPIFDDNCKGEISGQYVSGVVPSSNLSAGNYTATYKANDGNGNESTITFNIIIKDVTAPVIQSRPDFKLQLGADGSAILLPSDLDNGTSDDCGTSTLKFEQAGVLVDQLTFECADKGTQTVKLVAVDDSYNRSEKDVQFEVEDKILPTADLKATVDVSLDEFGKATLTTAQIIQGIGIQDNCGNYTVQFSQQDFDCSDVGSKGVTVTIRDDSGNEITENVQVVVRDEMFPTINAKSAVTLNLDADGNATLSVADVEIGSTDNCGIQSRSLSKTTFACGDHNSTVTYSVTDDHGNVSTTDITVKLIDPVAPVVLTQNITVDLLSTSGVTITPEMIDNGSTDNCSALTFSLDKMSFNCSDIGTNTVTLTAKDATGNTSTQTATVTVENKITPTIVAKNDELILGADGTATLDPSSLDNGSTGACGGSLTFTADKTDFSCSDIGDNNVVLTVEDGDGNTTSTTVIVTVKDQTPPSVLTKNFELTLDANGQGTITVSDIDNGVSDACGIKSLLLDQQNFSCADLGDNTVTLKAEDVNGNSASATAIVKVVDGVKPNVVTQNITVYLDADGLATIQAIDLDNGSSDACSSTLSFSADKTNFTCGDLLAPVPVTLTVTDEAGNSDSALAYVTVKDDQAPTLNNVPTDIIVNTASGQCDAVATWAEITANDNCSATLSISHNSGDRFPIGETVVTVRAEDGSSNSMVATFKVTVMDKEAPTLDAPLADISVPAINGQCGAMVNWSTITGTDNCGNVTVTTNHNSGDTFNVGTTKVTVTLEDEAGNTTIEQFNVIVTDEEAPTISNLPTDITVSADANQCDAVVTWTAPTANDNCGIQSFTADYASGATFGIGTTPVTYTAIDNSGNEIEASFNVIVEDHQLPVIDNLPANFTVDAEAGKCEAVVNWPAITASDNCSGVTLEVSPANGSTLPVGAHTITVTAKDASDNEVSGTFEVTVVDVEAPVLVGLPANMTLPAENGMCDAEVIWPAVSATDNCTNVTITSTHNSGDRFSVGTTEVEFTATDDAGNSVSGTFEVTIEDKQAPAFNASNIELALGTGNQVTLSVDDVISDLVENCGVQSKALSQSTFDCDDLGENVVEVSVIDIHGNETKKSILLTIKDVSDPIAVGKDLILDLDANGKATLNPSDLDDGSTDGCGGTLSYSASQTEFDCGDIGGNTIVFTVTDESGNASSVNVTVTVQDLIKPTVLTQNITVSLDASGSVTITPEAIDNGSSDNCGIASMTLDNTTFDCNDIGAQTVILTVTDNNGNSESGTATVTVEDNTDPILAVQDISVQLDASGTASIEVADIVTAQSDNCGIANVTLSQSSFDCANIGANTVTVTLTDNNGNVVTETATVTVEDKLAPVVSTQDITVKLDASGVATITVDDIDNGSTDNCEIDSRTLDITSFDCSAVGTPQTVTLTITDKQGNVASETAIVTVIEDIKPIVLTQNITVSLDASGSVTITPEAIDNGSSDNCGIASMTLDNTTFDCTDIGAQTVILTVTDNNGNSESATATVTVEDNIDPILAVQDLTVQLDASGTASIEVADIVTAQSDNCGIANVTLSQSSFDCANIGANTVTVTLTDNNGNVVTETANVTVEDNVDPVVSTQDITVKLDASGVATITVDDIDNGSTDNCEIDSRTLDITSFDCSAVGTPQTVTLTITDKQGNVASETAIVTVIEDIKPIVLTQNITVSLDASGSVTITPEAIDNGSSDNCGIASMTLDNTTFDCNDIGAQTVILTVTDNNGNSESGTATVTVEDNTDPILAVQDISVQLNASGTASIEVADIVTTQSDNCGVANVTLSQSSFDCANIGANTVTVTLTDNNGNVVTKTATVTLEDKLAPVVSTQDLTVKLDASGVATITVDDIDNGSTDNCEIDSRTLDITSFDCSAVGTPQTVTLTITDKQGNVASETAIVTVVEDIKPIVLTQNLTVSLDASGSVIITPEAIDNGSSDNCGIASMTLNQTTFDCSAVGTPQTVTLTVTDNNGNSESATATVTVEDNTDPILAVQDISVQLNASGTASLEVADIVTTQSDNCGVANVTLSQSSFDCANIGANTVTVTLTDNNGNVVTETATVTVEDKLAPVVSTQDLTVKLDASGMATITVEDIDNGSTDNCEIDSRTLDITSFDCSAVGTPQTVTLTITDKQGNVASETATVTVEEDIKPIVLTQNITVSLDASGSVTITPEAIDNGSSDNCGIASMTLDQTTFDCNDIGAQTVILTVTDNNGNSESATATVTVEDNTDPTLAVKDITIQLDASGNASIEVADIVMTQSDNCGIANVILSQSSFDCANIGANAVTVTLTDNNGNVVTATSTVTIEDAVAPVVSTQDITVKLDASGVATISVDDIDNGSTDNCEIDSRTLDITSFDCSAVGTPQTVTLTITDKQGNVASETATVTVEEDIKPTVLTQNITVSLDASGSVTITPAAIDNGSSDNCGIASLTLDQTTFDCSAVGTPQTVTLTVTDNNGNSESATATVTVEDNTDPTLAVQDITVQLDASGTASLEVADIVTTQSDNCGVANVTLSQSSFDCANIGANTVTVTLTDNNGNVVTATATVTVQDNVAPILQVKTPIDLYLDANGLARLQVADVDNGTSDPCGIAKLSLSHTDFNGADLGSQTIVFTAEDVNGNISTTNIQVNVLDNIAPEFTIRPFIELELDEQGEAKLTAEQLFAEAPSDNVGIDRIEISQTDFDCADVNQNVDVIVEVFDTSGNKKSGLAVVKVLDNILPEITAPADRTVNLVTDCEIIIPDFGTAVVTDNCTVDYSRLTHDAPAVFPLGETNVKWLYQDKAGNVVTVVQKITVVDDRKPVITNMPTLEPIPATQGQCGAQVNWTAPTASDNCELLSFSSDIPPNSFFSIGTTMVTYTAVDRGGNTTTATFEVTVEDREAPEIICPATIHLFPELGLTYALVGQLQDPQVNTTCNEVVTITNDAPAQLHFGTHQINWTVTDNAGNVATCQQTIVVDDPADLTIIKDCPKDFSGYADEGECDLALKLNEPVLNDWVLNATITSDQPEFFPIGTTLVTWTVTDAWGNTETCQQSIAVEIDPESVMVAEGIPELLANPNCVLKLPDLTEYVEVMLPCFGETTIQQSPLAGELITPERDFISVTFKLVDAENKEVGTLVEEIFVQCLDRFEVPNMISPNGDGYNDRLEIPTIETYTGTELMIFNRWGQEVFRQRNYSNDWDGRSQSGKPLPAGTYYYSLKKDGEEHQSGYIHIVL